MSIESADQFSFNRNCEKPNPCPFLRSACDNRIKLFSDSRFEQKRGGGFTDLPFDFFRCIFCFGAMSRQNIQLIFAIRRRLPFQGRFQQTLGKQVGIAAIRSCRVGIVLDCQTKVTRDISIQEVLQYIRQRPKV